MNPRKIGFSVGGGFKRGFGRERVVLMTEFLGGGGMRKIWGGGGGGCVSRCEMNFSTTELLVWD